MSKAVATRILQTPAKDVKRLVYSTPSAILVRLAKVFSISTLTVSSISTPALLYCWDIPAVQATGINEYMFLTALVASACSTGALHYTLSPFINNIYLHTPSSSSSTPSTLNHNGDDNNDKTLAPITPNTTITIETLDLIARTKQTTLQLRDLKPTNNKPLSTWTFTKQYLNRYPHTHPGRFWLNRRGYGDQNAMRQIVRVIQDQDQRKRLI
ncbi:unnamed protein product [Cunninghamella blakesleeana]